MSLKTIDYDLPLISNIAENNNPALSPIPILTPVSTQKSNTESLEKWIEKNGCEIEKYMKKIELIQNKGSASDTIIALVDLKTPEGMLKNTICKISFTPRNKLNNSLIVEQEIYQNIVSNLINNNHTPHLIPFIGRAKSCSTDFFRDKLSGQNRIIWDNLVSKFNKNSFDTSRLDILILGKSSGKKLSEFLKTRDNLWSVLDSIIFFQILYTLKCFENIKLMHNDLHFGNIFVEQLNDVEERIYYISENTWVKIPTTVDIKIYDFDRSSIYHPAVDRNFGLDLSFCSNAFECNRFVTGYDFLAVISGFLRRCQDEKLKQFIEKLISKDTYNLLHKQEYMQLAFYTENDINKEIPLNKNTILPIDNVIVELLKKFNIHEGMGIGKVEKGNVYRLPEVRKNTFWFPTSSETHQSKEVTITDEKITQPYIISLTQDLGGKNIISEFYLKEFNEIYIKQHEIGMGTIAISLFQKFLKKKNVISSFHKFYLTACLIISIPFTYKMKHEKLLELLRSPIFGNYVRNNSEQILECYHDIWNVFDNTIEIKMLKV